jgi:aminopeptidase N
MYFFIFYSPYKAADQFDLYKAFDKAILEDKTYPYSNFTQYYETWVNQPGFPLLTVNVNHTTGTMTLHQVSHLEYNNILIINKR